jgi:F-type H+-transporting ATPase subunit beta
VLLFVDNIFRFTQAGSEVSALLGRIPSAVGYQPTLATEMGASRSASPRPRRARSPRCRPSTCPPTTSPTRRPPRPSPTSTPPRCSRAKIAELGIYPAVDPLDSTSTHARPDRSSASALQGRPRRAADAPALQGPAGHHRHPRHGRALARTTSLTVDRARKIQRFLSQPFFVAEQFTGMAGQATCRSRTPSAASRRSSPASRPHPRAGLLEAGGVDKSAARAALDVAEKELVSLDPNSGEWKTAERNAKLSRARLLA